MRGLFARSQGSCCGLGAGATLATMIFFATSCDPPGKPQPEVASQDVLDFKALFADNCAGCHGVDGRNGPGRILNDDLYLAILPRETLKQILIHGRPGTSMPAWARSDGGPLSAPQIEALVNGMEQGWAKPVDFHGVAIPSYSAGGEAGDVKSGRKLFLRNCFACHGPGAKVGPVSDPAYLSLVSNQMLRTSILVGRPDLGMPDYRYLKLGKALNDAEIVDLVAFLASKRPLDANLKLGIAGPDESAPISKGSEGSGNGPGSPSKERHEGSKANGTSGQSGTR